MGRAWGGWRSGVGCSGRGRLRWPGIDVFREFWDWKSLCLWRMNDEFSEVEGWVIPNDGCMLQSDVLCESL